MRNVGARHTRANRRWLRTQALVTATGVGVVGAAIGVLVALPVLALGALAYRGAEAEILAHSAERRLSSTLLAASFVDQTLRSSGSSLEAHAATPAVSAALRARDLPALTLALERALEGGRRVEVPILSVTAVDATGRPLARLPVAELPASVADRPYFAAVQKSSGYLITDVLVRRVPPFDAAVGIVAPARDPAGFAGLLATSIVPATIVAKLPGLSGEPGRHFTIVDRASGVIASTDPGFAPLAVDPFARARQDGAEFGTFEMQDADGVSKIVTFAPIPSAAWWLYVADRPGSIEGPVRALAESTGMATTVLAAISGAIGATLAIVALVILNLYRRSRASASALEVLAVRLKELDDQREEFLSLVAHELRTPVASIGLLANGIAADPETGPQRRAALDALRSQSRHLTRLAEDLLIVSRLDAGGLAVERSETDVRAVVERAIQDLAGHARVRLHLPASPLLASVDAERFGQVVANLVSNALKYSPSQGPVDVTLRSDGREIVLEVSDDGIGFEPGEGVHLFQKYGRLRSAAAAPVVGFGLGLYLCRLIVEAHGGTIAAASAGRGQGSTFVATIPLALS